MDSSAAALVRSPLPPENWYADPAPEVLVTEGSPRRRIRWLSLLAATIAMFGVLAGFGVASASAGFGYLSQFGAPGIGNGQFVGPEGVAVDPATGDVYVADFGRGRVEKFDPTGTYLLQFGSYGTGTGQFNLGPFGLAVDPVTGDVYATDINNTRVEKFDSSGTYLSQFGSGATGNGQLGNPTAIAVDPSSRDVYVADGANGRVEKFDSSGRYLSQFGSAGIGDGQFNTGTPTSMSGIAVDSSSGDVYVNDEADGRVEKFDSAGTYLSQFGNGTIPSGIAFDPTSGDVYVSDGANGRVEKFDPAGGYLSQFGSAGIGDGQFTSPAGVAVNPTGDVYVVDNQSNINGGRVEKFGQTQAAQAISFISTPSASAVVGGSYAVAATGGLSGNPVTFSIDSSSTTGACSISGTTVSFTGGGSCVIDANQAGNSSYLAAPQAQQSLTVIVTPRGVIALTLQYVQGSAKYQALTAGQKAAITGLANLASSVLTRVVPNLTPAQKTALINAYKAGVARLKTGGWLTAAQAAILTTDASEL